MNKKRLLSPMFDKMLHGGTMKQALLLVVFAFSIFAIFAVILKCTNSQGESYGLWQLYYVFSGSGQQAKIEGAQPVLRALMAIVTFIGSIVFGGMLISTISNILTRRVDAYEKGLTRYNLKNHIIVIGSNAQAIEKIKVLLKNKKDKCHIIVLTANDVATFRNKLLAELSQEANKRLTISYGCRDSKKDLTDACIDQAKKIYIFGDTCEEDNIEHVHDALNAKCMETIADCRKKSCGKLQCCVSFDHFSTYHVFQYANLPDSVMNTIKFIPFNHNEMWAREVLVDGKGYYHLDYKPITNVSDSAYVHLIIIGLSKLGEALAMEAARTAHFPNYKKRKTKITIIDCNMEQELEPFMRKCGEFFSLAKWQYIDTHNNDKNLYSEIADKYLHLVTDAQDKCFIDSDWTFINGSDANGQTCDYITNAIQDSDAITTIAVCINETAASLRVAMTLPNEVYEAKIPVLVHQRITDTMVDALRGKDVEKKYERYNMLRAFGMEEVDFEPMLMRLISYGKRINYLYNHNEATEIDEVEAERLWEEDVPVHKRWSNIYSAVTIPFKYRCSTNVKWPLSDSEWLTTLAEMEHNRWMVEELLLGYRPVYKQEDIQIDKDKTLKRIYRDKFVHYDIRPNDGLKTDESGKNVAEYDEVIVKNLHLIYR